MNHHLSFGKHKGRTFEWVFFNDPGYAEWIFDNRIHRQEHNMDDVEGDYFRELYRRANHLADICSVCGERPLTRMGLTRLRGTGQLTQVGFYCEECEYRGGSPTEYHKPSFFVDAYYLDKREGKLITAEVKDHFIGGGNLTQKRIQEFFHADHHFVQAEAGFFTRVEVEMQQT